MFTTYVLNDMIDYIVRNGTISVFVGRNQEVHGSISNDDDIQYIGRIVYKGWVLKKIKPGDVNV